MNILILGSGGREHTLAWKVKQSTLCDSLFVAPGNAGTSRIAQNISLNVLDFESIAQFATNQDIKMIIVGPEDPLVAGIYDYFQQSHLKHIAIIGPSKIGAQLEGSKEFAKKFMVKYGIPTAKYAHFTKENVNEGFAFLEQLTPPYVLKADGLAAGKGVLIIDNLQEAKTELENMLVHAKFGEASAKVVIEEFLDGIELSCFVLTDGKDYKLLPMAKDYKRIGEGDTGLNTGGMGAVSPVPFVDDAFLEKIEKRIVKPTIHGFAQENIDYHGFVFIGLIKVNNEPYVIEYNVRMGDPETEVVIPRLENDLVALLEATAKGNLGQEIVKTNSEAAATVMMVSGGYPENYEKNKAISGLENVTGSLVFHAGTKTDGDNVVTNGGRVLAITSFGNDIFNALQKSYTQVKLIDFEGKYYRTDLGKDLA